MTPLHERTFLLLGGSGGIGQAMIRGLLEAGASVLLASRKVPAADTTFAPGVIPVQLDLASSTLAQDLVHLSAQHPAIDGLIHCAGHNHFGRLEALSDNVLDQLLDVNLRSAIVLARHFAPRLRAAGKGSLVFVGSTFGSIGYPGFAAYCASKAGLRGFVEALRREMADTAVQVQYVAPRATRTSMNPPAVNALNAELGNRMDAPEEVAAQILRCMRTGRARRHLGWPERFFVFLNSLLPRLVDVSLRKQLPIIQRDLTEQGS